MFVLFQAGDEDTAAAGKQIGPWAEHFFETHALCDYRYLAKSRQRA